MAEPAQQMVHAESRRGRGSLSNASGRFEPLRREVQHDGWDSWQREPPPLRTTVSRDASRTVIARNTSPDLGFDRSINPYRGCEHGCVYCFARPSHAFLGLSPGLDFESRLFAKPDAARLLKQELAKPGYRCKPIALGTNTDPYQPVEREWQVTRQVLEVLTGCGHPFSIVTKSTLVTRDIDILAPAAERGLVKVSLSVTTLDGRLARRMEPRAATPRRRLDAVAELAAAGIPTAVMAAPLIPALNDPELEDILEAAAEAGAVEAGYIVLRLPLEIKDLFREWLAENAPHRAERIMRLVRGMRGGRDYDPAFGTRLTGSGHYAELIRRRFDLACKRFGLNKRTLTLNTRRFRAPAAPSPQLSLF
jgi:DNA repair photolyase